MATVYPTTFPSPSFDGFSSSVDMGVIRADGAMDQAQRRVFTTMPLSFSLTFTMSVTIWGLWYNWVQANGYRWFQISLPTFYAGRTGDWTSPVLLRFTSDLSAANISATDIRVSVAAESAPSMTSAYLAAT